MHSDTKKKASRTLKVSSKKPSVKEKTTVMQKSSSDINGESSDNSRPGGMINEGGTTTGSGMLGEL